MRSKPLFNLALLGFLVLFAACSQQGGPAPSPGGQLTIAVSPSSFDIYPGGTKSVTINITRNDVSGPVTLTLKGVSVADQAVLSPTPAPDKISFTFSPNPAPGDQATLTLTVGSNVAARFYNFNVVGEVSGVTGTFPLLVNVQSAPAGTAVTVTLTGTVAEAVYQSDGSAWKPLDLSSGSATFYAQQDYQVMARCADLVYWVKADPTRLANVPLPCDQGENLLATTFNVTLPDTIGGVAVNDGDVVFVGAGRGGTVSTVDGVKQAQISATLPGGPQDLLVSVLRSSSSNWGYAYGARWENLDLNPGDTYNLTLTSSDAVSSYANVSFAAPSGVTVQALVGPYHPGMKALGVTGAGYAPENTSVSGTYGLVNSPSGVTLTYYGVLFALTTDNQQSATLFEDTGGGDWQPTLPRFWQSGEWSCDSGTLTLGYPASIFTLSSFGLYQDADTSSGLLLMALLVPSTSAAPYAFTFPDALDSSPLNAWGSGVNATAWPGATPSDVLTFAGFSQMGTLPNRVEQITVQADCTQTP